MREALRFVGIERSVKQVARGAHAADIGGAALQHEAAVAIAAIDIAKIGIDVEVDARMAKRGGDGAGAVASDAQGCGADGFGGWLHSQ